MGQRRLRNLQLYGRTGEARGFGNCEEVAQVSQFQDGPPFWTIDVIDKVYK